MEEAPASNSTSRLKSTLDNGLVLATATVIEVMRPSMEASPVPGPVGV